MRSLIVGRDAVALVGNVGRVGLEGRRLRQLSFQLVLVAFDAMLLENVIGWIFHPDVHLRCRVMARLL